MVNVFYDKDANQSVLKDKTVAIIGYGSQGNAQANNMRDSGIKVIVGLRSTGKSWSIAKNDGFEVFPIRQAADKGDIIHILIPDTAQPTVYKEDIEPVLKEGKTLAFSHGFNIRFNQIIPPKNVNVVMVAPKAPGPSLREMYLNGFGTPALIAIYQDFTGKAMETTLAMAKAIGCTKAGVIETTFKDETESDLIGEQTVLVGGIIELIRNGFEVLVESGYPPELAYFEACNEAKLIIDQIYRGGVIGMLKAVSDTAKYGGMTIGPKVIDEHVKENMRKVVENVQNGDFSKEWIEENYKGRPTFNALMKQWENHPLEKIGKFLRKMSGIEQ
jgi:ketol-acid reductoisomerase